MARKRLKQLAAGGLNISIACGWTVQLAAGGPNISLSIPSVGSSLAAEYSSYR